MGIPIIRISAVLLALLLGVKKGADARNNYNEANRTVRNAIRRHKTALKKLASQAEATENVLAQLGKLKVEIQAKRDCLANCVS